MIYGRLKGLKREELPSNVSILLRSTGLEQFADRLASKLSGGNQRKLSLAIALMGACLAWDQQSVTVFLISPQAIHPSFSSMSSRPA